MFVQATWISSSQTHNTFSIDSWTYLRFSHNLWPTIHCWLCCVMWLVGFLCAVNPAPAAPARPGERRAAGGRRDFLHLVWTSLHKQIFSFSKCTGICSQDCVSTSAQQLLQTRRFRIQTWWVFYRREFNFTAPDMLVTYVSAKPQIGWNLMLLYVAALPPQVTFAISLLSRRCAYALVRFRHKKELGNGSENIVKFAEVFLKTPCSSCATNWRELARLPMKNILFWHRKTRLETSRGLFKYNHRCHAYKDEVLCLHLHAQTQTQTQQYNSLVHLIPQAELVPEISKCYNNLHHGRLNLNQLFDWWAHCKRFQNMHIF